MRWLFCISSLIFNETLKNTILWMKRLGIKTSNSFSVLERIRLLFPLWVRKKRLGGGKGELRTNKPLSHASSASALKTVTKAVTKTNFVCVCSKLRGCQTPHLREDWQAPHQMKEVYWTSENHVERRASNITNLPWPFKILIKTRKGLSLC